MWQRPNRRDAERIDLRVTSRVVPLDVLKLRRLFKRLMVPVQVTHPLVNNRVARPDVANVTLEMLNVNGVEADDSDEPIEIRHMSLRKGGRDLQPDINLCQGFAEPVWPVLLLGEMLLYTIERLKESYDVALVCCARGSKTRLVDTVVD